MQVYELIQHCTCGGSRGALSALLSSGSVALGRRGGGMQAGGPRVTAVPDGLVPCREKWCHMTQEERDDSLRFNENITFGQLG